MNQRYENPDFVQGYSAAVADVVKWLRRPLDQTKRTSMERPNPARAKIGDNHINLVRNRLAALLETGSWQEAAKAGGE